jgi:hypothetical protein
VLRVIFSENRFPLFGITRQVFVLRVIFSENRFPLFGITRYARAPFGVRAR